MAATLGLTDIKPVWNAALTTQKYTLEAKQRRSWARLFKSELCILDIARLSACVRLQAAIAELFTSRLYITFVDMSTALMTLW